MEDRDAKKDDAKTNPQHDQNDGYIFCAGDGKEYVGNVSVLTLLIYL